MWNVLTLTIRKAGIWLHHLVGDMLDYYYAVTVYRVSNCVTRFLKQFEFKWIEAMEIYNLLTKTEEDSSSVPATI